ncbi:MAG: hypothetical protein ABI550_06945 [Ignavibacteriaceae bacterium]
MKKIFLFLVASSSFLFSQNIQTKNSLELKNEIKDSFKTNPNNLPLNSLIETEKKSTGLAILYSLLLPGMGELYADAYSSGKYFTIAEASLWGVYIGIRTYGTWQKQRYKSFAESRGGVSLAGKDEDYFAVIGEYVDIEKYNTDQALNRDFKKIYNNKSFYWNWETNDQRKNYRSMWVSSEQSFNNLRFIVGALIVNRIVSAINAVRAVSAYNKNLSNDLGWNISAGVSQNASLPTTLTLNFQASF